MMGFHLIGEGYFLWFYVLRRLFRLVKSEISSPDRLLHHLGQVARRIFHLALLVGASLFLSLFLYSRSVPLVSSIHPLYFDFRREPFPSASVFVPGTDLSPGFPYQISVEFDVPESGPNLNLGMVMVESNLFNVKNKPILASSRPLRLGYTSSLVRWSKSLVLLTPYVFGLLAEQQGVHLPLVEGYIPGPEDEAVRRIEVSVSNRAFEFYAARLVFRTDASLPVVFMFHHPLLARLFLFSLVFSVLFSIYSLLFASSMYVAGARFLFDLLVEGHVQYWRRLSSQDDALSVVREAARQRNSSDATTPTSSSTAASSPSPPPSPSSAVVPVRWSPSRSLVSRSHSHSHSVEPAHLQQLRHRSPAFRPSEGAGHVPAEHDSLLFHGTLAAFDISTGSNTDASIVRPPVSSQSGGLAGGLMAPAEVGSSSSSSSSSVSSSVTTVAASPSGAGAAVPAGRSLSGLTLASGYSRVGPSMIIIEEQAGRMGDMRLDGDELLVEFADARSNSNSDHGNSPGTIDDSVPQVPDASTAVVRRRGFPHWSMHRRY